MKDVKKKMIFLFALTLLLSVKVLASNFEHKITQAIHLKTERAFNGVVCIAKRDKILYQTARGGYGSPHINAQFLIGSIAKQMTAAIILMLVDQGLLDLNCPIMHYLPDLKEEWGAKVTTKHLLNHTSGITALDQPLAFVPGSQFRYSPTLAFYLLSQIAEKVSKEAYRTLLSNLFQKAHMNHSGLAFSRKVEELYKAFPHLIPGYKERESSISKAVLLDEGVDKEDGQWVHPGGGIISTAYDLLAWNLALHEGKLLSPEMYEQMVRPSSRREHPRYGAVGYGLGVQLLGKGENLEISHSGYVDGYISTLLYYPQSKISVIILENVSWDVTDVERAFSTHDHIRQIVRDYLGLPKADG